MCGALPGCVYVQGLKPPSLLLALIDHKSFYHSHKCTFFCLCFFLIIAIATSEVFSKPGNALSFLQHQAVFPVVVL